MSAVTISETRNLVLPLDTVLEALVHFDRKGDCLLTHGEVLQAKIVRGSKRGDGIDVALRNAENRIIEWHRFDFPKITAAIISFCRAKRIPLPFSGVKSLSLNKDGLTFRIENRVSLTKHSDAQQDLSGQPLRYARGYEPYAIEPTSKTEAFV
ncbi:MAG: hypothetical protein ABI769_05795 [Pseudomonadota bacterium]